MYITSLLKTLKKPGEEIINLKNKKIYSIYYWKKKSSKSAIYYYPNIFKRKENIVFISSFVGWSLGISKNSCNPYFDQNLDQSN